MSDLFPIISTELEPSVHEVHLSLAIMTDHKVATIKLSHGICYWKLDISVLESQHLI